MANRAVMLHGWYKECCMYFAENYLKPPAPVARREIAEIIRNGMTAECLKAIMDESQNAPRPSWGYAKAIVKRCEANDVRTLADWRADQARREAARNRALSYRQRDFSEEDVGVDFFADMGARPAQGKQEYPEWHRQAMNYTQREYRDEDFPAFRWKNGGADGLVSLPWDDGGVGR